MSALPGGLPGVPKEVMDGFWKLSDSKDNVRIDAACKILGQLKVSSKVKGQRSNA